MPTVKFSEHKDKIQEILQEKLKENPIAGESSGFTLIEGFMRAHFLTEISNSTVLGGPNIPLVGIIGNTS